MKRFECGFGSDDSEQRASLNDFIFALIICSRTFEQNIEFFNGEYNFDTKWETIKQNILTKITGKNYSIRWVNMWLKKIHKRLKWDKKFDVMSKILLFDEYRKDGLVVPKFWETEMGGDNSSSGTHWSQALVQVLTSELGYSHSEAMNLPLSRAFSEYFKCLESHGIVTLMDDDDLELVEESEKLKEITNQ